MEHQNTPFNPRQQVNAPNHTLLEKSTAMGCHAPELIPAINQRLEQHGLEPRLLGNPGEWTAPKLQDILEFAVTRFEQECNHLAAGCREDDGDTWDEIAGVQPRTFTGDPEAGQ